MHLRLFSCNKDLLIYLLMIRLQVGRLCIDWVE